MFKNIHSLFHLISSVSEAIREQYAIVECCGWIFPDDGLNFLGCLITILCTTILFAPINSLASNTRSLTKLRFVFSLRYPPSLTTAVFSVHFQPVCQGNNNFNFDFNIHRSEGGRGVVTRDRLRRGIGREKRGGENFNDEITFYNSLIGKAVLLSLRY